MAIGSVFEAVSLQIHDPAKLSTMDAQPESFRHSSNDLLRVASTVASISIALAALLLRQESRDIWDRVLTQAFLLAGLMALLSSVFAMSEMWREAGMSGRDLLGEVFRAAPRPSGFGYDSLVLMTWGLILLVLADLVLIVISID